jgi:outer membrane lipoprotein
VGKLAKGRIGEHPYLFPVVQVETYYLWKPIEPARYYPFYGSYYGFYGPYGPYGPYGFFYPSWYFWF